MLIKDGHSQRKISQAELEKHLDDFIAQKCQDINRLLIIPPDHTRLNSRAGDITAYLYAQLKDKMTINIMPALGTHLPMTEAQLELMFGKTIPFDAYLPHDWRNDLTILGELSSARIKELSEGKLDFPMQVAVNKELFNSYDLVISIGQIVPHEVIGMANYTKNIMIGIGGGDTINKSHYLGAVYGMERLMGETHSPVRQALNESYDQFVRNEVDIQFILTVIAKDENELALRGLYIGEDDETFETACELSREVNLDKLAKPLKKCVVYLDPKEFNSTWLGNKAIYRTRKAMADDGELIILAPDLHAFGEDSEIDRLIRKYGYFGTDQTLNDVKNNEDLANNLSAAAHLIHGTANNRFKITYCPNKEGLSQEEIESVGFKYQAYEDMAQIYNIQKLSDGWNTVNGEEVFYISNPALGLWTV